MIVLSLLKQFGIPETLDAWLEINFAGVDMTTYVFDSEIFEYLPERFQDEFVDRFSNYVKNDSERRQ